MWRSWWAHLTAFMQRADLHIEICGQGAPLVLLHGWGMHGGVWAGVADELARHHQLHVVDLPGYGGSAALTPYTLETLAARLIDALPPHFDVCGWSLGRSGGAEHGAVISGAGEQAGYRGYQSVLCDAC